MCLRILTVTTEYPPQVLGGLGTHLSELANGLSDLGCEVTVLSSTYGEAESYTQSNISVHWIPIPRSLIQGPIAHVVTLSSEHFTRRAEALIKELKMRPAMIHCHDWLTYPATRELGQSLGVPVVATLHLLYDPTTRWWGEEPDEEVIEIERSLCQQATALITVSHSMRELIKSTYGVPGERIRVIYNGMRTSSDSEDAPSPDELARLRLSLAEPDEKIIIFAGRMVPQKGITALLQSASEVVARNARVRYVIAGSFPGVGAERLALAHKDRYPEHSNLWDRLKFVGMVTRQHLARLYKVADIAVVPSVYEPFGYAAIEAMAAGLPVIATRAGGLAEVVVDGETGLLVPVHTSEAGPHRVDVEKLSEAQTFLLDNTRAAKRMGEAGRQRVAGEFTRERMVKSVRDFYRNVLAGAATA